MHDTFHVSLLKRFHADKHWSRKTNIREEAEEPETILKEQVHNGNTKLFDQVERVITFGSHLDL